jgi:hypothetical protein
MVWEVAGMRLVRIERRWIEGLIAFLKLFETFAESDEDPGILIDSDILLRRRDRHPPVSQALDNKPVSEYAAQNTQPRAPNSAQ